MSTNEGIGPEARKAREFATEPSLQVPEIRDAAQALQAVDALSGPENDNKGGKRGDVPEKLTFEFDYTDRRGFKWTGTFVNRILTIADQAKVGLVRAQLSAGLNPSSLDFTTAQQFEMRAHLAVSLERVPDWAKNLGQIRDVTVLEAIYQEVATHEARFWGDAAEGEGAVVGA